MIWQSKCQSCGHPMGDHHSAGGGGLHPVNFGFCYRDGCDCKRFVEQEPEGGEDDRRASRMAQREGREVPYWRGGWST